MARDTGWIGRYCASGNNFNKQARTALALPIGNVYYVDLAGGSDGNTGESFDRAMLTVNAAYDKVTADKNDYIVVTGWKTETGTGVIATLDVAQTHLIGHAGILNPYYPEKGSFYRSGAGDAPHTQIRQEFVEVAGITFNAVQGAGTESSTVSKGAIELGDYSASGGADHGNKAYVHNCQFPDWNSATTVTGMSISGCHYFVLQDISFESNYGNMDKGIYSSGSGSANPSWARIENIHFRGSQGGAMANGIVMQSEAQDLQSTYLTGLVFQRCTNAISLGAAYGAYNYLGPSTADCVENSFFTGGSACDARDDLWTNYKWVCAGDVWGRDAILAAS
jgi:hypothetical protein